MAPKRTLDGAATQRQEKRPRGGNYSMGSESCDEETTYDCQTQIWLGRGGVARADIIVRSSGIRWIAVQGNDCICVMSSDKNQIIGHDKDKGTLTGFLANLFKDIYDPYAHEYRSDALRSQDSGTRKSFAVVSVVLGTERTNNTFDLKTSNARLNAVKAINSLTEKLSRSLVFTFDESIQIGLFALQRMVGRALNPGDIKVCVARKGDSTIKALPAREIEKFLEFNSISGTTGWKWKRRWKSEEIGTFSTSFSISDCGRKNSIFTEEEDIDGTESEKSDTKSKSTSGDGKSVSVDGDSCSSETCQKEIGGTEVENKSRRNCKTTIWSGGFNSQLVHSSGFSWIGVLGKESICVVTGDKADERHLEYALHGMTVHPLFKDAWYNDGWPEDSASVIPFAAVSLVDIGAANVYKVPSAGVDGTQAIRYLKEKLNNKFDLNYEETMKTTFCALQYLWKDIKDTQVQAYVIRKEDDIIKQLSGEKLSITEIEFWLSMISPCDTRF